MFTVARKSAVCNGGLVQQKDIELCCIDERIGDYAVCVRMYLACGKLSHKAIQHGSLSECQAIYYGYQELLD
jgi:hypothetical protein